MNEDTDSWMSVWEPEDEKPSGASLRDRAATPSGPSPQAVSGIAGIPSAGDWCVVAEGRWRGVNFGESYGVAQIESVTPRKVRTVGGVHYRSLHDRHLVTVCRDEDGARLLCSRLESAKGEMNRRVREAAKAYRTRVDRLLASAMSAREGRDAGERLGAEPASAVRDSADAHPSSEDQQ